jgi:hypothetical protein
VLNTFLIALIVAGLALVYWRLILLVLGAAVIAVLVTGVDMVTGAIRDHDGRSAVDVVDQPRPENPPALPIPDLEPGNPEQYPPQMEPPPR